MPKDVVTTRFRPAKRRSVQATISSGVDASAISAIAGVSRVNNPCVSIRHPSRDQKRKSPQDVACGLHMYA